LLANRRSEDVNSGSFPRIDLGFFPTPIEAMPRISAALGIDFSIKRDDYTGFGGGGNKVRKLEYLMADALAQRARVLFLHRGGSPALYPFARHLTEE
jgi:1-aminocyclopropane-1-carboxylate deaminase/D-cysteine desulfhydrase-like pyridoxal-dependent ACC family enzyme